MTKQRPKPVAGFKPGKSGNPGGRPAIPAEVKEAARAYTIEAVEVLAAVMRDEAANPSARIGAAQALLNRAWGTPESTANVVVKRSARELTDDELSAIAAGGSPRADEAASSAGEPGAVH